MELNIKEAQEIQTKILGIIADVCDKHSITYSLCGGSLLGAVRHGGPVPWHRDTDLIVPENEIRKLLEYLEDELKPEYSIDSHMLDKNSLQLFPKITLSGYDSLTFHVDLFRLIGFPDDRKKQNRIYFQAKIIRLILKVKRMRSLRVSEKRLFKRVLISLLKILLSIIPNDLLLDSYEKLCSKYPYSEAPFAGYLGGKHGIRNMFKREVFDDFITVDYDGIPVRIIKEHDCYLKQVFGDYETPPSIEEQEAAINKVYYLFEKKK